MAQATVMMSGNVSPSTETISLLKNRSRRCRTRSLNCFCPADESKASSACQLSRGDWLCIAHPHNVDELPGQHSRVFLLNQLCEDILQVGQLHDFRKLSGCSVGQYLSLRN